MPTLKFKGKQHIYAHRFTIPFRMLIKAILVPQLPISDFY